MMTRRLRAFGLFWWDFLVGDAWELALGGVLVLGLAYLLRHMPVIAAILVPVAVIAILGVSCWYGRKR